MRASRYWVVLSLGLLGVQCNPKPDYLEMDPKEHVFKRPGEEVWWRVVPKTRQGKVIHKLAATWSSSDPSVATVDETGRVRSVAPGRATITATVGKLSAEAVVELSAVGKIVIEPTSFTMEARGDPKPFSVKVYDQGGRLMTARHPLARCQNEDVCRVGGEGVHPVDPGTTKLIVSSDSQQVEAEVVVTPSKAKKE